MDILLTLFNVAAVIGFVAFVVTLLDFQTPIDKFDRILLAILCMTEGLMIVPRIIQIWS